MANNDAIVIEARSPARQVDGSARQMGGPARQIGGTARQMGGREAVLDSFSHLQGCLGEVREPTPPRRRQLTRMSGGIWGAATPPSEWMGEDGCLKMAVFGGPFPHRSSPAPHLGLPAMLAKKNG